MNRYGLSLTILFTTILVFSSVSLGLEGFAFYKDMNWKLKLHNYKSSGIKPNSKSNLTKDKPCSSLFKKLDRFSPTQPTFLGLQACVFLFTLIYSIIIQRARNAGKLLTLTGTLYGLLGTFVIIMTISYGVHGVAYPGRKVGPCGTTSGPKVNQSNHEKFYFKAVHIRNFCFEYYNRKTNLIKISGRSYSEADARRDGFCQEYSARAFALLMGLWTGLMCLIVPCVDACCYPPMPRPHQDQPVHHKDETEEDEDTNSKRDGTLVNGSVMFNPNQSSHLIHPHHHDYYMDSHTTLHTFTTMPDQYRRW